MKLLDYFKLAIKNLKKRKLRTGINIISIAVGVMLIVTMVSLGSGLESYVESQMKELHNLKQIKVLSVEYQNEEEYQEKISNVNTNGELDYASIFNEQKISQKLIDDIASDDRVEDFIIKYEESMYEIDIDGRKLKDINIAYYNGKSYLKSEEDSLVEMNSKEKIQVPIEYIAYGSNMTSNDTKSILIPEDVAKVVFGLENPENVLGKEITLKSNVAEYDLEKSITINAKIIGIIDQRFFQPSIIVSKDIIEETKNFYENTNIPLLDRGADNLDISLLDVNEVPNLVEKIEQTYGYSTESVQTVAKTVNKLLVWLNIALSLIGLIVICIASLDVVNTMIMSIYERTKSIGLMKATGASNNDVLNLFLVEGGTIGLIGGIVGIVFSSTNLFLIKKVVVLISSAVTNGDNSFLTQIIKMDLKVATLTVLFAVFLTVLASLYPSFKASRLDPIDALKHD